MCVDKRYFSDELLVYEKPKNGIQGLINTTCFHLNWTLPFYQQTIEQEQPDLIHAHFGFDGYRMIKPAIQNNTPLITSFYGSDVTRLPTEFDWSRRYKKLARHGDAFIAISRYMKQQLIRLGFPKEKIRILPFGLDLSTFNYNPQTTDTRSIMMVGRMVEKKGFKYALNALFQLIEEGHKLHLDLYGEGTLDASLKQQVQRMGLQQAVTFHGYTPNNDIKEALSHHHVLLAPSITARDGDEEGLPNTILEAMASGTLVIASDHAAISEVILPDETGLLTPEKDAPTIAAAIKKALKKPDRTFIMKENARHLIEKQHQITQVIDQLETLYGRVINSH